MKKFAIIVSMLLVSSFATAQTTGTATQQQTSTTASTAGANNAGNAQNLTFNQEATVIPTDTTAHVVYSGTQTVKNVPSVSGPALTSSNDTCMGSSSGSANGPGFGISVGSTWVDETCRMQKLSRELWNYGMKAAALALMCNDKSVKEALEITGYTCPQTVKAEKEQFTNSTLINKNNSKYTGNDPIVKARMGEN